MKSARALVVLSALCAACAGGVVQAPPKPPSVERALEVPAATEVVLQMGEQLVAGATVLGVSVGTLDMRLSEKCRGSDGKWMLESTLGTAGVARWFDKTEGSTTTSVDPETLLPSESTTMVINGEDWRRYHIAFGSGSYHYYQTRSNGENKEGEESSPGNEPIHDTQTAYLLLRTWQPKPGEQSYFYVVLGKDLWRADVTYKGPSSLDTNDGAVKVRHIQGLAHRINLGPGDEYTPRAFALWLSDDELRTPLKVVGDGSLGSIQFALDERAVLEVCPREAPANPDSASAAVEGAAPERPAVEAPAAQVEAPASVPAPPAKPTPATPVP